MWALQRITLHAEGFFELQKDSFFYIAGFLFIIITFPFFPPPNLYVWWSSFSLETELPGYHALMILWINFVLCCHVLHFQNSFCINYLANGTKFSLPIQFFFNDSCMSYHKSQCFQRVHSMWLNYSLEGERKREKHIWLKPINICETVNNAHIFIPK